MVTSVHRQPIFPSMAPQMIYNLAGFKEEIRGEVLNVARDSWGEMGATSS